jgi:hypothetical protein
MKPSKLTEECRVQSQIWPMLGQLHRVQTYLLDTIINSHLITVESLILDKIFIGLLILSKGFHRQE